MKSTHEPRFSTRPVWHNPTLWGAPTKERVGMTDEQYMWAYIHWLEDWLKSVTERVRELEALSDAKGAEKK